MYLVDTSFFHADTNARDKTCDRTDNTVAARSLAQVLWQPLHRQGLCQEGDEESARPTVPEPHLDPPRELRCATQAAHCLPQR